MKHIRVEELIANARQPNEVAKLIVKLRWIGLEEEATRLQSAVGRLMPQERGTAVGDPFGTD